MDKNFFWVRQNTTKNEGGLEWNSLFGCIQYTPSFMISYKKNRNHNMFILHTWFVTTEEHFDMVVGSSVRTFSIKRWAWGLFFYSVIKVPNTFYLLNPTPRIAFSIRLLFPHKNTPHHHYVHRPCRRAKVDIWPWRGLRYLVFIYLDLPFPCCWIIAPRFHFLSSFSLSK